MGIRRKRPLEESEDPSSSSYEDSSDEKKDIDAPAGGKEIQSEPQSRGRSLSPERSVRTDGTIRLEPWRREKTVTKAIRDVEDGIIQGRYASEAAERRPEP